VLQKDKVTQCTNNISDIADTDIQHCIHKRQINTVTKQAMIAFSLRTCQHNTRRTTQVSNASVS